jgi:antirestriction protein ArdC
VHADLVGRAGAGAPVRVCRGGAARVAGIDHASYIETWLCVLRNDKLAILTAAAHAERTAA